MKKLMTIEMPDGSKWGAVSVLARDGKPLGLRLDEFEPLAWRKNETPNEVRGAAK